MATPGMDARGVEQPSSWLVCFHSRAATRWVERIPGRFKHVSAIGWFPGSRSWVLVEPGMSGTSIVMWPDTDVGLAAMGEWMDDCLVVRMPVRAHTRDARVRARHFMGWCVPQVRALVGVRGGALLPDGLLRDCLRDGGVIAATEGVSDGDESAEISADAGGTCGAAGREAAEGRNDP